MKIPDLGKLAGEVQRPQVRTTHDERFTVVEALAIENCWSTENGFSARAGRDWLATELRPAFYSQTLTDSDRQLLEIG